MNISAEGAAVLAEIAYEPDMDVMRERIGTLYDIQDIEFIYVKRTDTEGAIFMVDDTCVMIWPGTESIVDLYHDALFMPSLWSGGFIHSGFKKIFTEMADPLLRAFYSLPRIHHIKNLISVGHSLGAQVAMGAVDILCAFGYSGPHKIITFGCPNGWSRGARVRFNMRHPNTINYINPGDYVTWLLGVTSGRPGIDIKLSGQWGHKMSKYINNVKELTNETKNYSR